VKVFLLSFCSIALSAGSYHAVSYEMLSCFYCSSVVYAQEHDIAEFSKVYVHFCATNIAKFVNLIT